MFVFCYLYVKIEIFLLSLLWCIKLDILTSENYKIILTQRLTPIENSVEPIAYF
jgi:hypothetical protein